MKKMKSEGEVLSVLSLPRWYVAEQLEVNHIDPTGENIERFITTMREMVAEDDLIIDVIDQMREEK